MLTPQQQVNALIEHCWKQLLQLHKSLAELEKLSPDGWLKRAEEARALADITPDATAKRSLLDIADAYETLAKPTKVIRG
jgi:hypothetical protein